MRTHEIRTISSHHHRSSIIIDHQSSIITHININLFSFAMSLRFLSPLNSPPIVVATGVVLVAGLPFVQAGALSLGTLKIANLLAFATNVTAVSIPGRMDGKQDRKMREGDLNPELTALRDSDAENNIVIASRDRTLLAPAGWAFSIWAPIYLGEAVFVGAQFFDPSLAAIVPQVTVPFVAANLLQSLWCASFRPSYYSNVGWHKYVSVAMLGGTAVALNQVPFGLSMYYLLPMTVHFGWTTAATLVNLNGSIAMGGSAVSDSTLISTGHASAALATGMGVGVTVFNMLPAYGLAVAWALAGCASGMRIKENDDSVSDVLHSGAGVQRALLWTGSVLCMSASAFTIYML
jgi:hypothetical protein